MQEPLMRTPLTSIQIRAARAADAATIAHFNTLLAQETEARFLEPGQLRRGVEGVLADPARGTYWVAEIGAQIIGQLLITSEWSDWRNGFFWWIQSVYVPQRWRGQGVFQSLYSHVRRLASERAEVCGLRLYVEASNGRAKQTYERIGLARTHYEVYEVDFRRPA
jgi:GNAT superfamily N-acetyltransferase